MKVDYVQKILNSRVYEIARETPLDEATALSARLGVTRDVTDTEAQVKSLRDFVIAGLMSSYESCRYLNTVGCNRSVFSFRLEHQ